MNADIAAKLTGDDDGPPLATLTTPALLLDVDILQRNVTAMADRCADHGVAIRPHVKTAKCLEIARMVTRGQTGGITVSTLREAAFFIDHGFEDIVYAVGITPHKLEEVAHLQRDGARVGVLCDEPSTARQIEATGSSLGVKFDVHLDIDCGYGRSGLAATDPRLIETASVLATGEHTRLAGVLTHGGHSYKARSAAGCADIAEQERAAVVAAAETLRAAGLPCPVVSAGSTPTAVWGRSWQGVDELRPGNYVFFDLTQVAIGSCAMVDIAVSVLATVIGHRPDTGMLTIDAGSLAMSSDHGARDADGRFGYGLVCGLDGQPIEDLHVASLSQEHGWIRRASGDRPLPYDRLPIGTMVRVLPSHSCITAAMFDHYDVHRDGLLIARWRRYNTR